MFCSPIKWIGSLTKFHCAAMFCVGSLFCKLLLHGQVTAGVVQMHLGLHLVWKLLLQVTAARVVQRQPTQSANATQPTMHLGAITLAAQCSPLLGFSSTQFETQDVSHTAWAAIGYEGRSANATMHCNASLGALGANHLCCSPLLGFSSIQYHSFNSFPNFGCQLLLKQKLLWLDSINLRR